MRCKFCFATFQDVKQSILPKGHIPQAEAAQLVHLLADFGFEKINFAGGEPTLCPWLLDLIQIAKMRGMTTSIVTNGSKLSPKVLDAYQPVLDWIGLSIDSIDENTNLMAGRAIVGKKVIGEHWYKEIIMDIKERGFGFKINTVVNSTNHKEDMNDFISWAKPERWKIFQVLPVKGQNDKFIDEMVVNDSNFNDFLKRHEQAKKHTSLVPENNDAMRNSYMMIDPAGRFYDCSTHEHIYSRPILKDGVSKALEDVSHDLNLFIQRDGLYEWQRA